MHLPLQITEDSIKGLKLWRDRVRDIILFFSTSVSEKFGACRPVKLFEISSGLRSSAWGLFALVTYVVQGMLSWNVGILLSVSYRKPAIWLTTID